MMEGAMASYVDFLPWSHICINVYTPEAIGKMPLNLQLFAAFNLTVSFLVFFRVGQVL